MADFALNNGILVCGNIDRSDLKFILCLMCGVSQPSIDNFHTKEFYSDLCQLRFEDYLICEVFVVSITYSCVIYLKVYSLKHGIQLESFFLYAK